MKIFFALALVIHFPCSVVLGLESTAPIKDTRNKRFAMFFCDGMSCDMPDIKKACPRKKCKAKGKSYDLAGDGYCDDWVYLPDGKYPALISDVSNPLYNQDRIQECMNRCTMAAKTNAKISNKAFYIKSDRRCGCSSGACSARKGSGYTSYFTVEFWNSGTGKNCQQGNVVTKETICKRAALQLGIEYRNDVNKVDRPAGCYWYEGSSNKAYFNVNVDPLNTRWNKFGNRGGICQAG